MKHVFGASSNELKHYGVKGMKWGVRNGPPYPLDKSKKRDTIVLEAIESGSVSKEINREKQMRHMKSGHIQGRSYLDGDLEYAQKLVNKYYGTGDAVVVEGQGWKKKERITAEKIIGTYVDPETGVETKTNKAMIVYSKTGSHIYPRKEDKNG